MSKKVQQTNQVDLDEQRRNEEAKLKREEETRRKREEYKEVSERAQRQRDQAEEGKDISKI
jgi:hypothetical protein